MCKKERHFPVVVPPHNSPRWAVRVLSYIKRGKFRCITTYYTGPPNSHGWLDGGARSQNPGSRVGFLFRPGGHLDPTNVWSMDSSRRADVHGAFSFLVAFNFRNSFEDFNSVFFISTFLITTFHHLLDHQTRFL